MRASTAPARRFPGDLPGSAHRRLLESVSQVGCQTLCQLSGAAHDAHSVDILHVELCQLLQLQHGQLAKRVLPIAAHSCRSLRRAFWQPLLLLLLLQARLSRGCRLPRGGRRGVWRPGPTIDCLPPSCCLLFQVLLIQAVPAGCEAGSAAQLAPCHPEPLTLVARQCQSGGSQRARQE